MKQYKRVIFFTALLLVIIYLSPTSVFAAEANYQDGRHLKIATVDDRPLSIDRLLYTALNDIRCYADISAVSSLQQSYLLANSGERDGVISSTPNMIDLYPNLVQVPAVLDNNIIQAFFRRGEYYSINGWEDIAGLRVGTLTNRIYIASRVEACLSVTTKETAKLLFEGLAAGEYDIVVASFREHEIFAAPEGIVCSGELETVPEYLYLNKSLADLVPEITDAINNVFADGRGEKILDDVRTPEPNKKKTILHILSTNMDVTREERFSAALKEPFENDMSIEWYTVELHSRRLSRDSNRLAYFAGLLRQDCVSRDIAAIVVSGDDALDFLKTWYYLYFRNVPVLYYSVNGDHDAIVQGYEQYFTGIEDRLSIGETISAALDLFPGTKNLFVVNDYTTEGKYYRSAAESQLEQFSGVLNIEYNEDTDFDTLIEHLKELPDDALVFVGSYFCDSNGQYYPLREMKKILEKDCGVPIFAVHSAGTEYNSIGGKCLDYTKHGEIVSGMLSRVLNGENVADIPSVSDPELYSKWVFDKNIMDETGIKEKSLPSGSTVLNKPLTIWESDPRFAFTVVAALILCVAAAVGITYLFNKYRKQEELIVKDAKIREVKERVERIINTAPLAFMLTIDNIVVEANEYIKKHLGVRPGDETIRLYADPSQRAVILEDAVMKKTITSNIVRYNMPEGETHRFLSYVTAAEYEGRNGFILWGMDIEERERQKDQMLAVQKSLQTIIDMLPVAVRIMGAEDARLSYVNRAAMKLFKSENPEDLIGRSILDFMPETQPDGEKSLDLVKRTHLSERSTIETQCIKLTGEPVDVRSTFCTIDYEGKKSSLGILEDLTAAKEYERMMHDTAEKEREANQLKGRFLVNMSHEIRTPMNAIIGLTEIELHKNPPRDVKEIYKKINISAKNLLEIINDILDLSKIEAEKIELYEDEFELEDVFNSAMLVAAPRLDGKNVEFMLDLALDLPQYVVGDRTRLWQILKNFLDNSAKYTEKGKIVLKCSADKDLSDNETTALRFVIKDTGIGMNEEQLQKLFAPYEQVKNEAQKRYSGTGLGMAISKQLCEIMGGNIEVESHPGKGTQIVINIPFKRALNRETGTKTAPVLAGLNVLAVDDDQLSLDIMARLLKNNGINFVSAKSGMEAMDLIFRRREIGESFDLILLDYMMDGLNGIETAKQITLAFSKAPKLLMVTAYQKHILMSELEKNGIADLIEKPFIPSQFIHKLCTVMGYNDEAEAESEETFTRFKDANVLLCEDYRLNQEVAAGMFAQFGIVADIAENGKEGINRLNSGKEYDLIFMDLQMPVMDGYEATQIIRADPRFDKVPIVSLTADAMKEIVDKCLEMGMNDHIAKPIEFSSLQRVFTKWLPESKRVKAAGVSQKHVSDPENEALARFGGKKELYEKALIEFTKLFPEEWADFDSAVEHADETARYIHKLKGASGNVGEKEVYKCIVEFEGSMRSGNPDRELYELLVKACDTAKERILGQAKEPTGEVGDAGDPEELKELLRRLKEACESYDPVASAEVADAIKENSWAEGEKLREIFEYVRKYEFDAALDALNKGFDFLNSADET